jgi:putative FmdB family regulatory protein
MPIYEYRCAECGFEKEYLQKLSDAPISDCEKCGKPAMSKLISAAGFQLKGGGWYVTDFKNPKPKGKDDNKPSTTAADTAAPAGEAKSGAECGAGACPACEPAQ